MGLLYTFLFHSVFLYNVLSTSSEQSSVDIHPDGTTTSASVSTRTSSSSASSFSSSSSSLFTPPKEPPPFPELLKHGKLLQSIDPLLAIEWYNTTYNQYLSPSSLSSSSSAKKSKKNTKAVSTTVYAPLDQAVFLEEYADVLSLVKQYQSAVQARYRALDIKRTHKLSLTVADVVTTYATLATDLQHNGNYKNAITILQKAQALTELDNGSKAILLRMESSAYECNGQLQLAYDTLLRSKALSSDSSSSSIELTQLLQEYDLIRGIYSIERNTGTLPTGINPVQLSQHKQSLLRLINSTGKYYGQLEQLPKEYLPNLVVQPFMDYHDPQYWSSILVPVAKVLQSYTKPLAEEYYTLVRNRKLYNETECIHNPHQGYWSWYATNGFWVPKNSDGCSTDTPIACRMLQDIKTLNINHLQIMRSGYSVIGPYSHLRPHCGMTNGQLKFHLGVIVPQFTNGTACAHIRVANETRYWEEGKILFFDDSFEHEVWNRCDQERLVFQFVFVHPDLAMKQHQSTNALPFSSSSSTLDTVGH